MKLLVTGANGFIGRATVEHFAGEGWHVCGVSRTIPALPARSNIVWHQMVLPDQSFAALLREWRPDLVVHGASTAVVGQSVDGPLQDFEQSVRVWAHVIEAISSEPVAMPGHPAVERCGLWQPYHIADQRTAAYDADLALWLPQKRCASR